MTGTAHTPYNFPRRFYSRVALVNMLLTVALSLVGLLMLAAGVRDEVSAIVVLIPLIWSFLFLGTTTLAPKLSDRMHGQLWALMHRDQPSDPVYHALVTRPFRSPRGLPHAVVAEATANGDVWLALVRADTTDFDQAGVGSFQYRVVDQLLLDQDTSHDDLAEATLRMVAEAERRERQSHVERCPEDRYLLPDEQPGQSSLEFVRRVLEQS